MVPGSPNRRSSASPHVTKSDHACLPSLQETTDDKDLPEDLRQKIIQASKCSLEQICLHEVHEAA